MNEINYPELGYSSFILAFNNEEDLKRCLSDGCRQYPELKTFLKKSLKKKSAISDETKKNAIDSLTDWITLDFRIDYVARHLHDDGLSDEEYCKRRQAMLESSEYKEARSEFLKTSPFHGVLQKLRLASIVIKDNVWRDDGVIDYAVHGGILQELYPWFVYQVTA